MLVLTTDRKNVVPAKAARPSGPGSAIAAPQVVPAIADVARGGVIASFCCWDIPTPSGRRRGGFSRTVGRFRDRGRRLTPESPGVGHESPYGDGVAPSGPGGPPNGQPRGRSRRSAASAS